MSNRLSKVKELLKNSPFNALIITDTANITYLTNYSGFSSIEREAYLLITNTHQYLLTDGRYTEAVSNIPHFTLIEISPINSLEVALTDLTKKHKIKKLGIEENNLTVSEYKKLEKHFKNMVHANGIETLRVIKDLDEIKTIEKACKLGDKTFKYILKKIKTGVTEKEIAFLLETFIKKQGADISFPTIVAFGKNAAIPHHQTSNQKLQTNSWVLLDFGVKLNNYCSDMTRTIFFSKATTEQKRMHQTVLEAQNRAFKSLNSKASEVDEVARSYITSQGYPTIPHSLGHGIGIEVHESPRLSPKSKDILKPGMVFSIEPGIYLPGIGGVRIEDLVVLEKTGHRFLTNSKRDLIEL